ncbi:uro-adherence factor A-like isoform X2 [Montipora capricornis]|uniref:uro-adherence factor A-like isoform X2 n=1 Tax=Montipora capricornis TaxID=246305 RepID=UPI0035F140F1
MNTTNTVTPSKLQNDVQTISNDEVPKGRYNSAILTPRCKMQMSNTKLTEGYLRSFGFANVGSSSEAETPGDCIQQTEVADDKPLKSHDTSLTQEPTSPLPQEQNEMKEKHPFLSESQLNVMSFNLSEIADRISPNKCDKEADIGEKPLEALFDGNIESSAETLITSNDDQMSRSKTPYSRQRRGSKTFVSRQKSFTRKKFRNNRNSRQELNNNAEISVGMSNFVSLQSGTSDTPKHDNESDSGYSSSISTSISLSEEIESLKRLSLENGSSTDIETDDFMIGKDCHDMENSPDTLNKSTVSASSSSLSNQNASNVHESQLDSLNHGLSSSKADLRTRETSVSKTDIQTLNGIDEPSASFQRSDENGSSHQENTDEVSNTFSKQTSNSRKISSDDMALPRTKTGRRPGPLRRRTTVVSFRPPKPMTVLDRESDIVEMDDAGFLQMLTDLKSFKTQLLKLKRELQEADVVSPLTLAHFSTAKRGSLCSDFDTPERKPPQRKRMLKRTMTMDAATMQQRVQRTSSSLSSDDGTELADTTIPRHQTTELNSGKNEEVKNLHEELKRVKEQLFEMTEERTSLIRAREELEHELDSKNHTIRMLQKQLESQSDSQDEMAYLKREVKSLTHQIEQQQQRITELRYRTSSPSPLPMGTISKETVKADIRNRLRDAFVKHLGEYSKTHVQLSKYIQKAEQNITMAQKDKSRHSLQRSDSQSSIEGGQEDSDGRESESDSAQGRTRSCTSSLVYRKSEDSGSESGKSGRRRAGSVSPNETDRTEASYSECAKSSPGNIASPPFVSINDGINRTSPHSKTEPHVEKIDNSKSRKLCATTPRVRKLSRSKLLSKIEASPLSQSWTPGAIEKIVKSWRENKSPMASQEKPEEKEKLKLTPVSHVEFL